MGKVIDFIAYKKRKEVLPTNNQKVVVPKKIVVKNGKVPQ